MWPLSDQPVDPEKARLLETFISNAALAFEREAFEQKSKEADLLASSEKLHQALLGSVSHELKTPITALVGNASALRQKGLSLAAQDQAISDIVESAERLNRVVENLLDMTRISSGALKVREDIFELNDFVESLSHRFKAILKNHHVDVRRASNEIFVKGDEKLLEHVLSNVLVNAGAYTPEGTKVTIDIQSFGPNGRVDMMDEGPGFPEEALSKIFDRFYRVPGTRPGGTGLGLSLAKALIEAMGGKISAENRLDRNGARFTFILPKANVSFNKDGDPS